MLAVYPVGCENKGYSTCNRCAEAESRHGLIRDLPIAQYGKRPLMCGDVETTALNARNFDA